MTTRIKVYGTEWCYSTIGVRAYLKNARLNCDFFDVDRDASADAFVRALNSGARRYPVIVFPDEIVINPTASEIGQLLRLRREGWVPRHQSVATDGRGDAVPQRSALRRLDDELRRSEPEEATVVRSARPGNSERNRERAVGRAVSLPGKNGRLASASVGEPGAEEPQA